MDRNTPVVWSFWGHEPLRHLQRMGNDGDSIFTLGDWAKEWYDRIHTEEMVEAAAKKGVNVIYTHFFKGFGLETEREEMENTRMLCQRAAKHGIKVLGYCQLGSLYNETLMDEVPDLEDWTMRDATGAIQVWLGQYYRWKPCFNSRSFIEYIKKVIKYGIEHVGLSGFHFDNSYNTACHCEKCTQAFRDYLTEHADPTTMGLRHFRHVRIPPEDRHKETHDPLFIWWLRYKADLVAKVHEELFSYVKEVGGKDCIVLHNPTFPNPGRKMAQRGFEPSRISSNCDLVFAENGVSFIRAEEGRVKSMVHAFKFGERFGYKVFDTCWYWDPVTNKPQLPSSRAQVVRFAAQSMIYTGLCGVPWTARTLKDGCKNFLENSPLSENLGEAFGYYHKNVELFNLPSKNYVKILYSPDSCLCMIDAGVDNIFHTIDELVNNTIPFSLVTQSDLESLEAGQIVLLPKIFYADEALIETVRAAAARGVQFISISHFARYYEDGKERRHSHPVFALNENDGFYRTGDDFIPVLQEHLRGRTISVSEKLVMVERKEGKDGQIVLHLLHVANENTIPELTVTVEGVKILSADCISLENASISKIEGDTITIKNLQTTASIIIKKA
ncbi:MAG: beta-galactosidase [Oscillospiraceae bacterium]|nr:beta-galactosidase [Oscillospiraceae bacterium]